MNLKAIVTLNSLLTVTTFPALNTRTERKVKTKTRPSSQYGKRNKANCQRKKSNCKKSIVNFKRNKKIIIKCCSNKTNINKKVVTKRCKREQKNLRPKKESFTQINFKQNQRASKRSVTRKEVWYQTKKRKKEGETKREQIKVCKRLQLKLKKEKRKGKEKTHQNKNKNPINFVQNNKCKTRKEKKITKRDLKNIINKCKSSKVTKNAYKKNKSKTTKEDMLFLRKYGQYLGW